LNRWGILECVGADHIFLDDNSAVSAYDKNIDLELLDKYSPYATQTN
jgi:SulP family sulfate permease